MIEEIDILKRRIHELEESEEALRERMKELNGLYAIADIIEKNDAIGEIFQRIADILPNSWYYPHLACARITHGDQEYRTENFQETAWKISAAVSRRGKRIVEVEVIYLKEMPDRDEGPFLKEERALITAIAERLGRVAERKRAEEERERLISELQKALSTVKKLSGLLPICASCKKIRDDKGYWNQIESYIKENSEAEFSHGICPDCAKKLYPELCKETPDG
ncbi:MAG: hypothetical protein LLG97_19920 [Deltaproteobacteria bacterium]|nr:hypothetical protein [Deltaproteobacteria bacterium]